jgi:hypothetical protein
MKSVMIILLIICFFACNKHPITPLVPLSSHLTDGPWQLISATKLNYYGSNARVVGIQADSLLFQWRFDNYGNVQLTNIESYIGGAYSKCAYKLTPYSYGTPNIYDTILCTPAFRNDYSDTIFVRSFTDNLLVFQVQYKNGNSSITELDSLKKIRFY